MGDAAGRIDTQGNTFCPIAAEINQSRNIVYVFAGECKKPVTVGKF